MKTGSAASQLRDRFEEKYIPEPMSGCWLWIGAVIPDGYGSFRMGDQVVGAHCASYRMAKDDIPPDMCVLHKCDTRLCVNPDHLFLGTKTVNNQDRKAKGRSVTGDKHGFRRHPELIPKGEQNGKAKLTTAGAIRIKTSNLSVDELSVELEVHPATIRDVLAGRTWRHAVPGGV